MTQPKTTVKIKKPVTPQVRTDKVLPDPVFGTTLSNQLLVTVTRKSTIQTTAGGYETASVSIEGIHDGTAESMDTIIKDLFALASEKVREELSVTQPIEPAQSFGYDDFNDL